MVDLTVVSIPVYMGTMAAEQRYLAARAAEEGPSAADYTPSDTLTSLSMGLGSLLLPLVTPKIVAKVAPGVGRYGKALVGTAVVAAAATTLADRVLGRDAPHEDADAAADEDGARPGARRWVRSLRRVAGPVAVGAATLAASTWFTTKVNPQRQWDRRGRARDLGTGPLAWTAAIFGWDFIYYWNHRMSHEVRALWAVHVIHHSSERYNLSTALRQPVSDLLGVYLPYGLLARMGVSPYLITQARALNLLYQYWIHTETITSIGAAEAVLNTPSHHRVHHGSQRQYLDRNHGSILIVWDKLFGTFEPEDDRVVYGLTTNIDTFNPVTVATHEYRDIVRDVAGSTNWRDRLSFVLRGPGWAYERHHQLAARGEAIVADPAEAVTAA